MKMKQKLIAGAIALSAMAGFSVPAAHAEVAASVGAANMYYWRGADLGAGDAQVWGDVKLSGGGFYGGLWGSSGDIASGSEYDIYAGYGNAFGDFKFDLSVWTYTYPQIEVSPGDLIEVIGMIGWGPIAFTYYEGLEDLEEYSYMTLSATFGQFSIKYGAHDGMVVNANGAAIDPAHVDLTYAYNDKVSFTLGKVVDDGEFSDGEETYAWNDEVKFVVGLTLPIE
ncbi:MAG: hypothetical protein K0Q78_1265 [Cellvibrio sp.]|jgi:uncharacterized protein (TIGR02001 family)|nr:hypothetical protein [Cellvibrio sp.]